MPGHTLIIGGQRSGKSRYAEELVHRGSRTPIYLATATAGDGEMADRIDRHRKRRGKRWQTIEEPLELPEAISRAAGRERTVLVECLTLWVSNLMESGRNTEAATASLLSALSEAEGPVVLVSNEVGAGVIPANALARRYADALGTLNQHIASAVAHVVQVTVGVPVLIKPVRLPEIAL